MKITKFDASRVTVRKDGEYAGLILIRKSSGLDLGWEDYIVDKGTPKGLTRRSYGQIRIALTDGTYLDGMAIYVDDDYFEEGIDIIAGRLKSKPKLKRYREEDGEIIFDVVAKPVGEGNPINMVCNPFYSPSFTGERYTKLFNDRVLEMYKSKRNEDADTSVNDNAKHLSTLKNIIFNNTKEKEEFYHELVEAILAGDGAVRNCKNCSHYNGTLSMSDSPCYKCDRRMGDYWTPKKG